MCEKTKKWCKEGNPASQPFIMEMEPVVEESLPPPTPVIFNSHASYTRCLVTCIRSGSCVGHNDSDIDPVATDVFRKILSGVSGLSISIVHFRVPKN